MDYLNIDDEYKYWNADMFFPSEDLNSCFDEEISVGGHEYSSSPDGGQELSSPDGGQDESIILNANSSKNIVSERNRRKKLTERLLALRSVVPNITKLDRASIIKDAIEYIQTLHDEERRIQAEISELESGRASNINNSDIFYLDHHHQDHYSTTFSSSSSSSCNQKRTRLLDHYYHYSHSSAPTSSSSTTLLIPSSPIQLLELKVSSMGERTIVVSLTCSKRTDTMVKLCEIFESLNVKIITANITAFSGRLLKTVFLEGDEEEREVLSSKIRAAIASLNDPDSPMSI